MTEQILVVFEALPQAGAKAPEEFRVIPLGDDMPLLSNIFPAFSAKPEDLDAVINAVQARKLDVVIDYEHQTLKGGKAPAAGWIKGLEARADGLWAKVDWTPKGRDHLQNREYRYFSPVMKVDPATVRPYDLHSVALTNTPSIIGLEPLVAKAGVQADAKAAQAARAKEYGIGVKEGGHVAKPGEFAGVPDEQWADPVNYRYPMGDEAHCRNALSRWGDESNREQYTEDERNIMGNRMKRRAKALGIQISEDSGRMAMKTGVVQLLALREDTPDAEVLATLKSQLALAAAMPEIIQAVELDKDAAPALVVGRINAFKATADGAEAARTELLALKAEQAKERAEGMIKEALRTGRTSPEELDRNAGALRTLALKDEALFKTLVMEKPAGSVVPIDKIPKQPDGKDKIGAQGLDTDQVAMCASAGIKPEAFKASHAQLIEQGLLKG